MGGILLLLFLLFAMSIGYPAGAVAYKKLIKHSPQSLKEILAEL